MRYVLLDKDFNFEVAGVITANCSRNIIQQEIHRRSSIKGEALDYFEINKMCELNGWQFDVVTSEETLIF